MKVPLKVDAFITDGNQYLKYWFNSEYVIVKAPFQPYFYSTEENPNAVNEIVNKSLLYNSHFDGNIYKCIVKNTKAVVEARDENSMESNVKFIDRVYIDLPEFLFSYANTNELKVLSLDIETHTFMTFPNSEQDVIIAIGLQLNGNPIRLIVNPTWKSDRAILEQFVKIISILDPDIIVTYNGNNFDWPYIVDRLKINKIPTSKLTRDGSDIYFKRDQRTNDVTQVMIGGRVHYDLYARSVLKDQNLFKWSPKSFDMKTIATLYGLDDVIKEPKEVMANMRAMVNTQELRDYLTSDIRCTSFLTSIYLPAIMNQAEYLQVSLDSCINMTPSYTGNIIFSRKFHEMGIISDMTVGEAYPELSETKEGALVKTFKFGLFKEAVRDVDIISFYPNLIRLLNLCPTTTRIVDVQDVLQPFSATVTQDNYLILSIPDNKANKQVVIEIDRNNVGFASSFVDEIYEQRVSLKRKMKTVEKHSVDWNDADVNQLNLKVIMNAMTGFFGQKYARFGSLACYIAITGTGRYILQCIRDRIGESVIAINTDGLYTLSEEPIDDLNHWLEEFIKETFQVDKNYIALEESMFDAAFFVEDAEKQYLLLDDDELIIHGASLKGSRLPKIYSRIVEELGYKMLKGTLEQSDVTAFYDKTQWTIEDLQMGLNCKVRSTYKSRNTVAIQLINQYENRFNSTFACATKLYYVKVRGGKHKSKQRLVTIFDDSKDITDLDYEYYKTKVVDSALHRLSLTQMIPKNASQKSLFDFG